jgi:hypothetical protein
MISMMNRFVLPTVTQVTVGLAILFASMGSNCASAATAIFSKPAFDDWSYQFNGTPGERATGPTFRGAFAVSGGQFVPETASDPARRAVDIFAFDTANISNATPDVSIATGLPPSHYQIQSVTMTLKMQTSSFGAIHYSITPESPSAALAEVMGGSWSSIRPIELFGVGLRQDFTAFDFTLFNPEDLLINEGDHPYTANGYIAHPLAGSNVDPGGYADVSNNITGGYSATATGNSRAPFVANPWAVGTASGLTSGSVIPAGTIFTFNLNLDELGVRQYIQQSLSEGTLALSVSTLHAGGQPGSGSSSGYPQWFMKESVTAGLSGAAAPTLSINYTIQAPSIPGDFDGDDDVDGNDLADWQASYGLDSGGDADDDGDSDGRDFLIWQRNYTDPGTITAISVPEPTSLLVVIFGIIMGLPYRMSRR